MGVHAGVGPVGASRSGSGARIALQCAPVAARGCRAVVLQPTRVSSERSIYIVLCAPYADVIFDQYSSQLRAIRA